MAKEKAEFYDLKAGGVPVNPEPLVMTKAQRQALKDARSAMVEADPERFGTDDDLPLDVLAAGIAAYLESQLEEFEANLGAVVRFAMQDEANHLRGE